MPDQSGDQALERFEVADHDRAFADVDQALAVPLLQMCGTYARRSSPARDDTAF